MTALALGGLPPAGALATWSAPQAIGPVTDVVPNLAAGADGTAIAGLSLPGDGATAAIAFRPAGAATFLAPARLQGAAAVHDSTQPGVAVLPDGSGVALWDEETVTGGWGLYAVAISPAGVPAAPVRLSDDDQVSGVQLRVDAAGRVTALWQRGSTDELRYAVRGTDGGWSAVSTVAPRPRPFALAVAPSGEAYVVAGRAGEGEALTLLHRAAATGPFTAVRDLSVHHGYAAPSAVVADEAGGFAIAWREDWDGFTRAASFFVVQPPGGTLGAAREHPAGPGGDLARLPDATVLLGRRTTADPDDPSRQLTVGTAAEVPDAHGGGATGAPRDVTVPGADGVTAAAGGGRLLLGMIGPDPLTAQPVTLAAFRNASGEWTAPTRVSDTLVTPRSVAVAAAGQRAAIAWIAADEADLSRGLLRLSVWSPGADPVPVPPTAAPATPAVAPNSSTRQGGAGHTGAIAGTRLSASLRPAWTVARGWASDYVVQDHGRVFTVRAAAQGLEVVALDVRDGHELWAAPVRTGHVRATADLAVAAGTLVVASGGVLEALDPASGASRWHVTLPQPSATPPVIAGDRVLLLTQFTGATASAYALADGRELWRRGTPATLDLTVAGDRVVGTPVCGPVRIGLRVLDGAVDWLSQGECADPGDDATGVFDGRWVWVASPTAQAQAGRILDPETGRVLRTFRGRPPAFAPDGTGYRVLDGALIAFDARTLTPSWRFAPASPVRSLPLVTDGLVTVQEDDGTVSVLDRRTGMPRYEAPVPRPPYASFVAWPSLSAGDGHLLVPSAENALTAFVADPPADDPPADDSPADDPPADDPPVDDPPVEAPPVQDPPAGAPAPAPAPAETGRAPGTPAPPVGAASAGTPTPVTSTKPATPATAAPVWQLTAAPAALAGGRLVLGVRCTGRGTCSGRITVRVGAATVRGPRLRLPGGHRRLVRLRLPSRVARRAPRSVLVTLPGRPRAIRVGLRRR